MIEIRAVDLCDLPHACGDEPAFIAKLDILRLNSEELDENFVKMIIMEA